VPIRLIATDLDHTLLAHDRRPHPRSAAALQRAAEAGITVVLASGRIRSSIVGYARDMEIDAPIIAANGADVLIQGEQEIAHYPVPLNVLETVYEYAQANQVHFNVYSRFDVYFVNESDWGDEYLRRLRSVTPKRATLEELRTMDASKLLLIDDPARTQRHRKALEPLFKPSEAKVTESEPEYLEFLGGGISKGSSLKVLADHLGIRQEETAAIGDFLNDLEMIEWAGIGGAVGNAMATVREAADLVVASNDEGGVADFVDAVLNRG